MSRCNKCGCNPCGGGCCEPARYSCDFSIQVDPYDPYVWLFDQCGKINRVRIPKMKETDTFLRVDHGSSSLVYDAEYHRDVIDGCDLGSIINLDCLRDVEAPAPESCDFLVFDPGCSPCGDGCKPRPAMWRNYHIPDAEDCTIEPDEDGYSRVLTKDECGCIVECRLPAASRAIVNYIRDSVPDDSDFPWYYGNYNDHINLHLRENAGDYFGKFDLKVTINYGVQAVKSDLFDYNYNWRSLMVPVIEGESVRTTQAASILQSWAMMAPKGSGGGQVLGGIPWGTSSLRGTITVIVPKGKEAYLHHEFRIRNVDMSIFPHYKCTGADGQKAGDTMELNSALYPASRLNALQIIVEPVMGSTNYNPVVDPIRDQLDEPVDSYDDGYEVRGC